MTALAAVKSEPDRTVRSELLGTLQIAGEQLFSFPGGLPGFPECRSFALLPTAREGVFWLQSADFPALSFMLVDPFAHFPGYYHVDLISEDFSRLETERAGDILVMAIVTLPEVPHASATVNLRAPVLLNVSSRTAFQSIRPESSFGVREALDLSALLGNAAA